MTTIPVNELVNVNPSVVAAGGSAISASGLVLTPSTRVPLLGTNQPTVLSFGNAAAVTAFFGTGSKESQVAGGGTGFGTGYFGGFTGANKLPASILFAQYNQGAVPAYLRGGSVASMTLAQLQALSGSLNVTMDGYAHNAASVNLSGAVSFSSAASIIQTALNAAASSAAVVTGSIAAGTPAVFTGSIAGQLLTVASLSSGTIQIGGVISGTGVTAGTTITGQISGTTGGAGVYSVSASQTVASTSITETFGVLTVTAVTSGALAVGQTLTGTGVSAGTLLTQLGTGTGGTGTYFVNLTQTAASTTITGSPTALAVTFDSVSGAFVITSGISGPASTAAFATGTISGASPAGLNLTSATGAVVSQGAGGATQSTFMNNLIVQNSNWVTFSTDFDPDGGVGLGNLQKQAFAAWKNTQNNRFAYVCWDTDITATQSVPAASSLGQVLPGVNDSGTALIYTGPTDLGIAYFVQGAVASIDYTQAQGRVSLAYKSQPGLVASVSDPTSALNLGGNPQQANSFGNNYNFYGAYGSATTNFVWFQRGEVTGPYIWLDSYINQIVMNYSFQNAILTFLGQAKSVPYTVAGNNQIEAALAGTIQQFLSFGAFGPGTLSASEISSVNAAAGTNVSNAIQAQGWYLQILPAQPTQRAQRTSPPMTFWYLDSGSVQSINLSSVTLQ